MSIISDIMYMYMEQDAQPVKSCSIYLEGMVPPEDIPENPSPLNKEGNNSIKILGVNIY